VIENVVEIDRPPEDVFDYLSDPRGELEWNPQVEVMEKLTDGPVGVGTVFRAKWSKSKLLTMTCTAYERPVSWTYVNDGPVTVTLTIVLSRLSEGTKLTSRFDAHPHGMFRLVFPIFIAMMRREEAANMRLIKQAVEARPRSGA
jgi:uncharacterized protein YndB with AHSA1/START domain